MAGLEILHHKVHGTSRGTILFVHGICVGAWVWEPHFLPYFAKAGFDAYAVSLRGHGKSEGHERITQMTLESYASDVAEAAKSIGKPLLVVGHSLGGAVVQYWRKLGGNPVGTALLASVPPWGLGIASMQLAVRNPALFQAMANVGFSGVQSANKSILRQGLFSSDVSEQSHESFEQRVENESPLIAMQLQGLLPFAPMPWPAHSTFVLGAADDQIIPQGEVKRTASYYNTSATIVPKLAHTVMLDTRWEDAAKPLLAWATSVA